MREKPDTYIEKDRERFREVIGRKAVRKLRAQRAPVPGVWAGLGTLGLIGWSVVVPTLMGAVLGTWLDRHHAGVHSWSLPLLAAGLVIGCCNAWSWITKEDKAIQEAQDGHPTNE